MSAEESSKTTNNKMDQDKKDPKVILEKMGLEVPEPMVCKHKGNCMCKALEIYFKENPEGTNGNPPLKN